MAVSPRKVEAETGIKAPSRQSSTSGSAFRPDTIKELQRRGHTLREGGGDGNAQVIVYDAKEDMPEGGSNRRASDGAAVGVPGHTPVTSTAAQR